MGNKKYDSSSESSSDSEDEIVVKKVKKVVKASSLPDKKKSSNDSSEEKPVGKLGKKDLKNLERQKEIFEELKELLGVTNEKPVFTSFKIDKKKDKIINLILPEAVKVFNSKVWSTRSNDGKFHHMTLIRNMFKYFGYQISYRNTTKKTENGSVQGRNFIATQIIHK